MCRVNDMSPSVVEAFRMYQDAFEKQIPKKMKCYEDKYMHCPKCEEALGYKWKKYPAEKEDFSWLRFCWNCGQKLMGEVDECTRA